MEWRTFDQADDDLKQSKVESWWPIFKKGKLKRTRSLPSLVILGSCKWAKRQCQEGEQKGSHLRKQLLLLSAEDDYTSLAETVQNFVVYL